MASKSVDEETDHAIALALSEKASHIDSDTSSDDSLARSLQEDVYSDYYQSTLGEFLDKAETQQAATACVAFALLDPAIVGYEQLGRPV
jgi:hypothetical protein